MIRKSHMSTENILVLDASDEITADDYIATLSQTTTKSS